MPPHKKTDIRQNRACMQPRTALIHDWLLTSGGAEAVFRQISSMFSGDIFTLFFNDNTIRELGLNRQKVHGSFLMKMPFAAKKYRSYLPFFPLAAESWDLSEYDLILSSSHAVAKGVLTHSEQLHICYCYTPMRYAWDLNHEYLKLSGLHKGIKCQIASLILHYLRLWDASSHLRVDKFIACSSYVAKRIKKIYGRQSEVIYPPVDLEGLQVNSHKENFYLTSSRLVPYKKTGLIVEAFRLMPERRLIVTGDGPEMKRIAAICPKNVTLAGWLPRKEVANLMQRAKAFVYAAREDFGIVNVEAQACATPVIAYGKGGARETIIEGKTGIFFHEQEIEAICDAISRFETLPPFNSADLRENAERFRTEVFTRQFGDFVRKSIAEFYGNS